MTDREDRLTEVLGEHATRVQGVPATAVPADQVIRVPEVPDTRVPAALLTVVPGDHVTPVLEVLHMMDPEDLATLVPVAMGATALQFVGRRITHPAD